VSPEKLVRKVRRSLEDRTNEVWLSPISIWELMLLVEKGRMVLECSLGEWIAKAIMPLKEAPLTAEIVLEMGRFSLPHGDPADRFLVATARSLGLTLITTDKRLLASNLVPVLANVR
jgi:PIN domain nuclease of toxin-antitoxin system